MIYYLFRSRQARKRPVEEISHRDNTPPPYLLLKDIIQIYAQRKILRRQRKKNATGPQQLSIHILFYLF